MKSTSWHTVQKKKRGEIVDLPSCKKVYHENDLNKLAIKNDRLTTLKITKNSFTKSNN